MLRATPLTLLIMIVISGALSPTSGSGSTTDPEPFIKCYTETREILTESTIFKAVTGKRNDITELGERYAARTRELLASMCIKQYPKAAEEYQVRKFSEIIREDLQEWLSSRSIEEQRYIIPSLLVVRAHARTGSTIGTWALYEFIETLRDELLNTVPGLTATQEEKEIFRLILTRKFSNIKALAYHPTGSQAYVTKHSDLFINLDLVPIENLPQVIFHEAVHNHIKANKLRLRELKDMTGDEWIYLTIEEEFRARYLTGIFLKRWNNATNQQDMLLAEFEAFTRSINQPMKWINMEQKQAVLWFLDDLSLLKPGKIEKMLHSWMTLAKTDE